jgi:hypothetical protein
LHSQIPKVQNKQEQTGEKLARKQARTVYQEFAATI